MRPHLFIKSPTTRRRDIGCTTARVTRAGPSILLAWSWEGERERAAYPSVSENKGEIVRQRAQPDEQRQKGSIKSSGFYRRLTKWAPLSPFVPISPRNDRSPYSSASSTASKYSGKYFPPRSLRVLIRLYSSLLASPASFQYPGRVYSAPPHRLRIIPIRFPAFFNSFGKLHWTVYTHIYRRSLRRNERAPLFLPPGQKRMVDWETLKSPDFSETSIAWKSASLCYASCPRASFCGFAEKLNFASKFNFSLSLFFFSMHTKKFKMKMWISKYVIKAGNFRNK